VNVATAIDGTVTVTVTVTVTITVTGVTR